MGRLEEEAEVITTSLEDDRGAQTRSALEAYFRGFNAKDLSLMPIDEDVYFKAPVNPEPVLGLESLGPFLEQVFSKFDRIVVQRTIVEGEFASVMLD